MTKTSESSHSQPDLAAWLLAAIESHTPSEQIHEALVSRYGMTEDEARITHERARNGVLKAISGTQRHMPDSKSDPVGYAMFNMVWSTFNQNSFFDRRRAPSRKWLDWKDQQQRRQQT